MYYHHSALPKEQYLAAMKQKFTNPLFVYNRRLTGMVLGSFFAVAHYQDYEWNRRITGECNRAWGYVQQLDGQLEIRFHRGKGLFAPCWIIVLTLLCRAIFLFYEIQNQMYLGSVAWAVSYGCALVAGLSSAFASSVTEEGQAGVREIDKFLMDPQNYYC